MQRLVMFLAAAAGMAAAGCGRQPDAAPLTLDAAIDRATAALCDLAMACEAEWGPVFEDAEACAELAPLWLDLHVETDLLAVHRIDAAALDACLSSLVAAGCRQQLDLRAPSVCIRTALVGTLTTGACCDARGGCEPDLDCALGASGVGVCMMRAPVGKSCRVATCADGLYCDGDEVCRQPGGAGAGCSATGECGEDLVCGPDAACQPPGGLDAACNLDEHCDASLYCHLPTASCRAPAAAGEACDAATPCQPELYCHSLTSTCEPLPGDTEPCTAARECAAGAYCALDLTCTTAHEEGGPCTTSLECAQGLECDDFTWTCRPPPQRPAVVGERCDRDGDCPWGADCVVGDAGRVCAPHGLAGAACDDAGVIAPRCAEYLGLVCLAGVCQPAPGLGESCPSGVCRPLAGVYCDSSAGLCARRPAPGQSCEPSGLLDPCRLDAFCDPVLLLCLPAPEHVTSGARCP